MPFKKGQSGNPGGRPKEVNALRDYIGGPGGSKTKEDIDAIRAIAEDVNEKKELRFKARTWLVEQRIGKAPQAITGVDGAPLEALWRLDLAGLAPEELEALDTITSKIAQPDDDSEGDSGGEGP